VGAVKIFNFTFSFSKKPYASELLLASFNKVLPLPQKFNRLHRFRTWKQLKFYSFRFYSSKIMQKDMLLRSIPLPHLWFKVTYRFVKESRYLMVVKKGIYLTYSKIHWAENVFLLTPALNLTLTRTLPNPKAQ